MSARTRSNGANPRAQICCVTIGYEQIVLPAADGLRMVELLQRAVRVRSDYGREGVSYESDANPLTIALAIITADRLRPARQLDKEVT